MSPLRLAVLVCVASLLTGCRQLREPVRSLVHVEGAVLLEDGSFADVTTDEGDVSVSDGALGVSAVVAGPWDGGPGFEVGLTASLVEGEGCADGCDVEARICVCHFRSDEEPWCATDDERHCVDVEATMFGTYMQEDCHDSSCLQQVRAIFHIPEGGEFLGDIAVVHEEEWKTPPAHV